MFRFLGYFSLVLLLFITISGVNLFAQQDIESLLNAIEGS